MKIIENLFLKNKVIFTLFFTLFIGLFFYILFGHKIVEIIYKSESSFFNKFIEGRKENSLTFYLNKADILYILANLLFASFVIASNFFLRNLKNIKTQFILFIKQIIHLRSVITKNKKTIAWALSLFCIFYLLYVTVGILLIPSYQKYSFFSADIWEWTSLEWSRSHKGSHPLILIFLQPFSFLRFFSTVFPKVGLAVILNSFFGAFAIFLAFLFFLYITKKYIESSILTILFGLSMSQLVFSSVPESYALASCSIVTTYILFLVSLKRQKLYLGYWIFAGIFSFGVTITNFAQTLLCFVATMFLLKNRNRIITILEYVSIVIFLSFLLSILQHKLLGGNYFFVPNMINTEVKYTTTTILKHPLLVFQEIIKHFFLVNFVAASPFPENITSQSNRIVLGFYQQSLDYNVIGFIGTIIWLFLLIKGIYNHIFQSSKIGFVFFFTICSAIFLNMVLHSFFGVEYMFLYTCNFTFPVLLLAVTQATIKKSRLQVAFVVLIILAGINNLMIIRQIIGSMSVWHKMFS